MIRPLRMPILACILVLAADRRLMADGPASQPAGASQPCMTDLLAEIRQLREQMQQQQHHHEAELRALQAQIAALRRVATAPAAAGPAAQPTSGIAASQPAVASAPASAGEEELASLIAESGGSIAPTASQPSASAGPMSIRGAIQSFNPDISLNADFLGAFSTHNGGQPENEFLFRELEIGFSGAIDPYTRADMIVTIGRDATTDEYKTEIEEGYITYLGLPYDLQARFGQFRADFGRVNPMHLHALPWIDYPFVIKRYFGGDGLLGTGAELSWLVPNPWHQYVSLSYEVFNNDNDSLFAGQQSDDFVHLVRLKSFRDLSPESTLEFGGSFATAPNDSGHGENRSMVEGVDLTYRWKPKEAGLYRSFLLQNEVLFAQADLIGGQEKTWGMYSAAEYQFERQWKFGVRYDNTQIPFSSSLHERGYSAYLTFLESEFVFWRLGYLVTDRNFREDGDKGNQQVFLQLNLTLGAHPAHKY